MQTAFTLRDGVKVRGQIHEAEAERTQRSPPKALCVFAHVRYSGNSVKGVSSNLTKLLSSISLTHRSAALWRIT